VTAAEYLPSGPLDRLELGNGLAEVREFDARYFPARITVGEIFDWIYTTDAVGNITSITDGLDPSGLRSYGYQDFQYFLTQGDGPWGDLAWTYDKIGNRLSETRDGAIAVYGYFSNAAGGRSAKLAAVSKAGGVTSYFYDAIGDQTAVASEEGKVRYSYDAARRLSRMTHDAAGQPPEVADVRYDGRSFLHRAILRRFTASDPSVETTATYSSEGLLHHRGNVERPAPTAPRDAGVAADDVAVVYFAGRPVVQVVARAGEGDVATHLTTDHLGTPTLATDSQGFTLWEGGFEPFGRDWRELTGESAKGKGLYLRLPGQWEDGLWEAASLGAPGYYNVHRWYEPTTGRYSRPDPNLEGFNLELNQYGYGVSNPLRYADTNGLDYSWPLSPTHGTVVNLSDCGLLVVGDLPFQEPGFRQIFPLTPVGRVFPGYVKKPWFTFKPDVDFVCLQGTWYKVWGLPIVVTPKQRLLGFFRKADRKETTSGWLPPCTEGCLCPTEVPKAQMPDTSFEFRGPTVHR
jgi:RHS repeat-associated protein